MKVYILEILGVKLFILLSYLLVLFVLARICGLVKWCFGSQWHQPKPSSLTVGALTVLLEERGIDYKNIVEKSDLVRLVEHSGQLTQDETESIQGQSAAIYEAATFSSGHEYYNRVERSSDSAWLVMMLASSRSSSSSVDDNKKRTSDNDNDSSWKLPLKSKAWSAIVKFAGMRNIRVGVLNCVEDVAWCESREVVSSRLVLTLPRPFSAAPSVSTYSKTFSLRHVCRWMLGVLRNNIRRVMKPRLLHNHWLTFRSPSQQPETHVVLITGRTSPEPFFTAVAARFPDLAKFAWLNLGEESTAAELEKWTEYVPGVDPNLPLPLPLILVANSEAAYVYGQGSRRLTEECFTERCLVNFLVHLRPTKNAGLQASFVTAIVLAVLEILITDNESDSIGRILRRGGLYFLTTALLWCVLPTDSSVGALGQLNTLVIRLTRYMSLTSVGAYIRHGVLLYTDSKWGVVLFLLSLPSLLPIAYQAEQLASKRKKSPRSRMRNNDYDSNIREGRPWYASTRPLPQPRERMDQTSETVREGVRESRSESERRGRRRNGRSPRQDGPRLVTPDRQNRINDLNDEGVQAFLIFLEQYLNNYAAVENLRQRPQLIPDQLPNWSHGLEEPPEVLTAVDCEMCVICREEFSEGESMTGLPCRHIYHRDCVVKWLTSGVFRACPLCRS